MKQQLESQAIADQVAEMRAQADAILTVCPGTLNVETMHGTCANCVPKARALRENADRLETRGREQLSGEAA